MPAAEPQASTAAPDFTGLEQLLRVISSQLSTLHQPYQDALTALRGDLAEIGRALTEAMPRRAIETLEAEVRSLAERIDLTRQAGAGDATLTAVEHELAEVRDALRGLTPAESLVGFEDSVRELSRKIDLLAQGSQGAGDPLALKQLEQAVVSLRGEVSNVASDGALSQLAAEVRNLSTQFERAAAESSFETLSRLESRIVSLMESGRTAPELEGSILQLSERLDRMQLSEGDRLALESLEDRIAKLSEKLDASDARLGQLDSIGRVLADLLVHLEEMKSEARAIRAAPPAEFTNAPVPAPQPVPHPASNPAPAPVRAQASPLDPAPELPQAALPAIVPAPEQAPPAPPAAPVAAGPQPAPAPTVPQRPSAMPQGSQPQPIDPNLPPDTPLEPGSGAPRMRPGSAAARIAASEAALSGFRSAAADPGSRVAAITAARNAARAAYLGTPLPHAKTRTPKFGRGIRWPFGKKGRRDLEPQSPPSPAQPPTASVAPQPAARPEPTPAPTPADDEATERAPRNWRLAPLVKKLLIAASLTALIVAGAVMVADMLTSDMPPPSTSLLDSLEVPPGSTPDRPIPSQGALTPSADPEPTGQIGDSSSFFDPTAMAQKPPGGDITGSVVPKTTPPWPQAVAPVPAEPTGNAAVDALPALIGPGMRQALAASDPAAEFELGLRYLEGRGGAPQSAGEAVRWLQRASDAGFAPAQFRLAGLYEKGDGVRKDQQTARGLYLAAAGKGLAKAMHNLAVLYSEGIDGKPDYRAAAEWFRKAASYGVTDSQYNLAILYARGIGVQANLVESYRWFALAAAAGDAEAAKKRDQVAARLDPQTLVTAKAAVLGFVAEREPNEAINLRTPPGGWDKAPVVPAKPKRS